MKKIISVLLVITMLGAAGLTVAEESASAPAAQQTQTRDQDRRQPGRGPMGQNGPMGQRGPNGQPGPNGSAGEKPADAPELPNGEKPAYAPELPDGQNGSGFGPMGGPGMGAPRMIDFDSMVTRGVISQDTCDRIRAYMEANRPVEPQQADGEAPQMNGEAPQRAGLLDDLLRAGVITQTEYDALSAAE